jgi:hypothetical protein
MVIRLDRRSAALSTIYQGTAAVRVLVAHQLQPGWLQTKSGADSAPTQGAAAQGARMLVSLRRDVRAGRERLGQPPSLPEARDSEAITAARIDVRTHRDRACALALLTGRFVADRAVQVPASSTG